MRRTLTVSLAPAAVLAAVWLRLEYPLDRPFRAIGIVALALLPALVRNRLARVAALVVAVAFGAWLAFDVSPFHPRHFPHALGTRFGNGVLDFYDVQTPFDPRVHAEMRGTILAAIFGFVVALSLAVAARRPLVASLVVLLGAGWPATLRGSAGALAVGVLILLAVLVVLAGLTTRGVPRAVLPAGAVLVLAALIASASAAVAKGGLVSWQHWDPYTAPQPPVSVAFVWDAQYNGIQFPKKRTTVLEVKAPRRSLYWRAAVLDEFTRDHWEEEPPLRADALVPSAGKQLLRQDVHVLALADTHLVGASVPLRYDAGEAPIVTHVPGIASLPSGLTRGFRYTAWSYAPRPTAAQLDASKPIYPVQLVERGTFLDVWHRVNVPAFGAPGRAHAVAGILESTPVLTRYAPLFGRATEVAGGARSPYAAAAALEQWFRFGGGFTYTNHPVSTPGAPLVDFVAQTRAGYCQHFAGAMALMLRYLGVPARVAVGFSSGTYNGAKGVWRVSDHDAHAWVEVWFRGYGWLPFDPTPSGRPELGRLSAPYATAILIGARVSAGRAIRGLDLGDPRGAAHHHGEEGTGVKAIGQPQTVGGQSHGSSLLLLLALLAAAIATGIVITKLAMRRARYLTRDPRRLAAACRQELADYLLDQRIDAARSATLHELGALVRHELAVDPDAFVGAATAARFGPPGGAAPAARRARRELRVLLRGVRVRLPARDRIRGLLSLRSFGFAS
ncbi:MAG: transglutaminaseTgpA domain-containing protein [Actinomycetota bacterium]